MLHNAVFHADSEFVRTVLDLPSGAGARLLERPDQRGLRPLHTACVGLAAKIELGFDAQHTERRLTVRVRHSQRPLLTFLSPLLRRMRGC